ncbi:hypothetical protein [Chroococcus sp. FPU101]|uniref:hypothetical protein n=1 Tax=Chroococcus sp. FPU101 TaxID=1974212 RepID=UPI001A8C2E29|nr:hypothetical protein [Chroococcus sp. FPU101]GFE70788.1 hypothetical protein CFPU101_33980 [Chroococcus sp. FPU101]
MLKILNKYLNKKIATYDLFDVENPQVSIKSILIEFLKTLFVVFLCADLLPHPALKQGLILSVLNQTQHEIQKINPQITTNNR